MDIECEINLFFFDLFGIKVDSKSDLFLFLNYKINYFDFILDIIIKNLILEDNINFIEYLFGFYNFLGNELEFIFIRDFVSVENIEEIDKIIGDNFDINI